MLDHPCAVRLARDLDEQRRDGRAYTLVTTEQMAATLTIGSSARANHAIVVAGALTLPEADLPMDAYLLGVWLGARTFASIHPTADAINRAPTFSPDKSGGMPSALAPENVGTRFSASVGRGRALIPRDKHIPTVYLRASEQQRRSLLAGLLDTDGTVNRDGATEFTTTSLQLAQDMYELIGSLGFRPALREGRASSKERT